MRTLYRVEIFEDNNWVVSSRHRNPENAEINADVAAKSRKVNTRVIYDGKIIYEVRLRDELSRFN